VKNAIGTCGLDYLSVYQRVFAFSLKHALREQRLWDLVEDCRRIVPDISAQHTRSINAEEYKRYAELKMRGMHAFQVRCMLDAVSAVGKQGLTILDIGDSSGTHACYLKALTPPGAVKDIISVNVDPVAVEKVRNRGGTAILCRAEDLALEDIRSDLFMSFEMVEHLMDPAHFFYKLATAKAAEYFLLTVPYRRESRVGFGYLRSDNPLPEKLTADDIHIFELSYWDWVLLSRFSGWKPVFQRIYLQYPRYSPIRLLAPLWRLLDYEGFVGLLLRRDLSIAQRYVDW